MSDAAVVGVSEGIRQLGDDIVDRAAEIDELAKKLDSALVDLEATWLDSDINKVREAVDIALEGYERNHQYFDDANAVLHQYADGLDAAVETL